MTLNKAGLTDAIYNQLDLPKTKSAQVVDSLLEIMEKTLVDGEDVLISGFKNPCFSGCASLITKEKTGYTR